MTLLHNRGPCTFCIQMQNCTRVPQPHLNCAHCLSHSLTNWPSFPYREPSAVLHLILAISRKPTRAQLIELGGSVGGLPPARHFLSFVHPAPHPWSQTSDSLRATLTQDCFWMHPERGCEMEFSCQEDWFLCGNLRCYSACIYLLYTQKLFCFLLDGGFWSKSLMRLHFISEGLFIFWFASGSSFEKIHVFCKPKWLSHVFLKSLEKFSWDQGCWRADRSWTHVEEGRETVSGDCWEA